MNTNTSTNGADAHIEAELRVSLDGLQDAIGAGNRARGFHEEGDALRAMLVELEENCEESSHLLHRGRAAIRNYYITELALIGTEVSEAIEELRNGRAVDERYYSGGHGYGVHGDLSEGESVDIVGALRKPEGVPSELADVVIRAFDLADEAGFSLGDVILEKLAFNGTRGFRHGGKAV